MAFGERPLDVPEAERLARASGAAVVHIGAAESLVEADVDVRGRAARVLPDLVSAAIQAASPAT